MVLSSIEAAFNTFNLFQVGVDRGELGLAKEEVIRGDLCDPGFFIAARCHVDLCLCDGLTLLLDGCRLRDLLPLLHLADLSLFGLWGFLGVHSLVNCVDLLVHSSDDKLLLFSLGSLGVRVTVGADGLNKVVSVV